MDPEETHYSESFPARVVGGIYDASLGEDDAPGC